MTSTNDTARQRAAQRFYSDPIEARRRAFQALPGGRP